MRLLLYIMTAALTVLPAFAQKYEFALAGGGSFYQSHTVTNPKGDASAGFDNGWAASVAVGNNMYSHVGGEVRYTYLHNDAKLSSGSTKATFGAESHVIHYDFLIHATPTESRIRPYVAAGGGIKFYRGTGTEVPFQPLSSVALLTKTTEVQGLLSVGGGVKFSLTNHLMLRVDVHDYLTPFPKKIITPALNSKASGWFNNIVGTAGISFGF
jgi:outer membrane protein W